MKRKQKTCIAIANAKSSEEIFAVLDWFMEKGNRDWLTHKNGTKTRIQKEIDNAFFRFIKDESTQGYAMDLKATGLLSNRVEKIGVYKIGDKLMLAKTKKQQLYQLKKFLYL